jgi:hypothetical protein
MTPVVQHVPQGTSNQSRPQSEATDTLRSILHHLDREYTAVIALVGILAVVYANTLAPDITWANRGYDGGDLITAAATGGIAHPPGYPTYLVLARFAQLLPLGSLAFRTNLMSAVCAILTAVLVANLVRGAVAGELVTQSSTRIRVWSGALAGLGFGLSSLVWSQAVITEVYALNALFVALIIRLTPLSQGVSRRENPWLERLGGLVFGLGMGNQVTIAFLLPIWLMGGNPLGEVETDSRGGKKHWYARLKWDSLGRRLIWIIPGLCIYLILPLRARTGSPLNWGDPTDLSGFWWLVSGQLYQGLVFSLSPSFIWPRIQEWAWLLRDQFGLVGLIVGLFGLSFGSPRSQRFYWITGYIFLIYTVFGIGYDTPDSYLLLIPANLSLGLWFGLGTTTTLTKAADTRWRRWLVPFSAIVLALALTIKVVVHYPEMDASQNDKAVEFGGAVLSGTLQDAILVTRDNEDTFTMWYYHFALGKRPDIAVINSGSLVYDWYRERMQEIYPGLVLEDPHNCYECVLADLWANNDRPVCETFWNGPDFVSCGTAPLKDEP